MPIYTRTGDRGKTSLFDGTRVLKSHKRVETYGTIDELNSMIGAAIAEIKDSYSSSGASAKSRSNSSRQARTISIKEELEKIQHDLLDIGSALATPHPMPVVGLENRPKVFEGLIDKMTLQMPELKAFILPGGGKAGSLLHVCRTIARRAERQLVSLMQKENVDSAIITYLNRLSDLLFTMARYVNFVEKKKEVTWIKK
jgi:cob(I)alamin adenosyltransferase